MLQDLKSSWKAFLLFFFFLLPAGCGNIFPAKSFEVLEEVAISWQEARWIWRWRQEFIAQFVQLLKRWLCNEQLGTVVKNWVHSVDRCWLQALQFVVHLIDLLSILLRCNGFPGIQKAVVDQTGSRPPNSDHNLFLVQIWLWSFFSVQLLCPMSKSPSGKREGFQDSELAEKGRFITDSSQGSCHIQRSGAGSESPESKLLHKFIGWA